MTDFNQYDELEAVIEYGTDQASSADLATDIRNLLNVSELEIIERWAFDHNLIDDEQALSDQFDESIAPMVIEQYGVDDIPAMSEAFNDWSDSLCKDGELHDLQYSEYCYIGKYS